MAPFRCGHQYITVGITCNSVCAFGLIKLNRIESQCWHLWSCKSSCRRRRPVPSSINAEMIKSASGHDYGVDEPLELRTAPVVDGSDYVTRVLCTGCGRDFDVLHSDSAAYAPVIAAHAHDTADLGGGVRSFAGCRSLSVVPLEPEPPRRVPKSTGKSSFQTIPGWVANSDCGGTCSCPGSSSMSEAGGAVSTSAATCGRSRRVTARTSCELWRSVDDTHLSLS